jgi:DNA primase
VSRYTADSRDRVFDAVDMVSLVSARTDLRRAGADSYFGLCPFHDERTGSFHVRPDEKHYYCFGCQAAGDPFSFVMETEGLDFKAALEALADRFGVTLETEDEDPAAASRRQRRERLYTLLGRAATYYARYLWESTEAASARAYLLGRGLTEETLREFRVGYAPSAWDKLWRASRSTGFSDDELLAAGLLQRSKTSRGQVYDRFRERIMFPSVDARGRVRGFGARAMRDNQQPKYLNTSDGEVYHKRSQLFGIDLARAAAARAGRMILVEGYTDVLALHQAGIRNAVGIMGTALTEEQVRELARIVQVLELCLDADRAGQDAMLRAAKIASEHKPPLELRVVPLPEGTDPADLIERQGADALRELVGRSQPFVVFHVESILSRGDVSSAEGKDAVFARLAPVLAEVPPSSLRDDLMRRVAGRLELSSERLASLVAADRGAVSGGGSLGGGALGGGSAGGAFGGGGQGGGPDDPGVGSIRRSAPLSRELEAEHAFLALCIALPDAGEEALASIDPDEFLTSELFRRAARHLSGRCRTPMADLPPADEELARTIADLVARAGRREDVTVERLEHARLLLDLARLERAIVRTRSRGEEGISQLARERESTLEAIHGVVTRLERAV